MMDATDARTCDLCGYLTSKASHFKRRKIIHSGEKPFKCGSCEYSTTCPIILKRHSFTHNGNKPYQCGRCENVYTKSVSLKRHTLTHTKENKHIDFQIVEEGELLENTTENGEIIEIGEIF